MSDRFQNDFNWPGESAPRPFPAQRPAQRRTDGSLIAKPSADRNAPCPCGSGKKYKKCCL